MKYRSNAWLLLALTSALPRAAHAGWGDESWGEMVWGAGAPVPVPIAWWLPLVLAALLLALGVRMLTRPRRSAVGVLFLIVAAVPVVAAAATISVPYAFSNGTTADATEVNANFDTVVDESNDQDTRIGALETTVITGVTAGNGLLGGGIAGGIGLDVDTNVIQQRVTGSCAAGESIRAIASNGTVVCEPDDVGLGDITGVTAGTGLLGGGSAGGIGLDVDTNVIQQRVTGSCAAGESIRAIASNGTVVCEPDDVGLGDITGVTADSGLSGGGTSGAVSLSIGSGAVTSTHLASDSVASAEVVDGSLGDGDLAASIAGSGTSTLLASIRRFYIAETNGLDRSRVKVVCNGEGQGNAADVTIKVGGVVFDTYACSGGGGRPWTYISPEFDSPTGTNVDVQYQLAAPGRFYWREVSLVPSESPIVVSSGGSTLDDLTSGCANFSDGNVTVNTPGRGTVRVSTNAWLLIAHTQGVKDETLLVLDDTSAGGCSDWMYTTLHSIPASWPSTAGTEIQTVRVERTFTVASAGSHTFYLNGRQSGGYSAGTDKVWWVGSQAVYHPGD